ncbi:MAG: extracellular solute-binding protein [Treponema sp.]
MKKIGIVWAFALWGIAGLTSCAKKAAAEDANTLYLFNWTYYTPDAVIAKFEKEFGCGVKVDSFDSNEAMYAKLKAGAGGYDITFPSQDYAAIMIQQGMLREIDASKLENMKYINPLVLEKAVYDPEMKFCVPYYMGAAGIAVNKKKVSSYERSWSIFARKDLAGYLTMMDDMREVFGAALRFQGHSVNTLDDGELRAAAALIEKEWKPNIVKFDAEGFGKAFAAGDFWVCQGYAEAVFGEVSEEKQDDTIDFFIPEEGGPMYIDSMVILKNAKHYELALKFIDFIHRPEVYAEFLDAFRFPAFVNTAAAQYTTKKPMYRAEELENCELKTDLGEGLEKYNELWQDIRFSAD